jgi:hypothetical protein
MDLSTLSDADLMAALGGGGDVSSMSDADLMAAINGPPSPQTAEGFAPRSVREIEPSREQMKGAYEEIARGERDRQGPIEQFARTVGRGMSRAIPFADDLSAGMNTLGGMVGTQPERSFDENLLRQRGYNAADDTDRPVQSIGGQLAGGMALPGPTGLLRGALAGAGYGAAYGLGAGDGLEDRLTRAATGGALGGAVGGAVGGIAGRLERSAQGAAQGGATPLAQAAGRLNVEVPLAAASDNPALQWAGGIARNVPLAGTPLRQASERALTQIDDAARGVAQQLGRGRADDAGGAVREGITRSIRQELPARVQALEAQIDNLVDPQVTTPLQHTQRLSQQIAAQNQAAARPPGAALGVVHEALTRPGGLTYEGLRRLRSAVGEMIDQPTTLPADMNLADLRRLYGSLAQDLRRSVGNAGGPDALRAFERAQRFERAAAARREQLAKVIGRNAGAKSDEAVFEKVRQLASSGGKADARTLWRVRRALDPQEWDDVVSATVTALGRAAPDADFSPQRFMTQINKMSAEGRHALLGGHGRQGLTQAIEDLHTISERFQRLQQYANPSGTGHTLMGGMIGAAAWVDPITTLTQVAGGNVVARILARPVTAQAAARWARAYEAAARRGAAGTRTLQRAAQQFAERIGKELGVAINPMELLGGMRHASGGQDQEKDHSPR